MSDLQQIAQSILQGYGSRADKEFVAEQLKAMGDYRLQTPTAEINAEEMNQTAPVRRGGFLPESSPRTSGV